MSVTDHLQSGAIKVIGSILRRFPLEVVRKFARSLGTFFYRHIPIRKDVALANLRLCFPEKSWEELDGILARSYVNIATVFFEFLYFPKLTRETLKKIVRFKDNIQDVVKASFERGNGIVMISGHFSNWELAALSFGDFTGKSLAIIVHPFHNKSVDKLANAYRSLLGNSTIPMGNSIRQIISTLRANGIAALLADQSASKESGTARFFGIDVPTFQGPATFALRTGATVIAGFIVRAGDGNYDFRFHEIGYGDLDVESEQSVRELTQRHVSLLEKYIREYPEMWLWFHKRFKHISAFEDALLEVKGR